MGYPHGLRGEQIPFLARIISVVDAFDAMTSDRQYRSRMDVEHAKNQLVQGRGTQFDSQVVDVFLGLLERYEDILADMAVLNIGGHDPYNLTLSAPVAEPLSAS